MTNRFRAIRKKQKITQEELARLVGVSQPYIHDLEHGYRGGKEETLQKLAEVLRVPVDELFAPDDNPQQGSA